MIAFLDIETTGLNPEVHEPWEIALIVRGETGHDSSFVWQLPVDLGRADAMALTVSRFYGRRLDEYGPVEYDDGYPDQDCSSQVHQVFPEQVNPRSLTHWAQGFTRRTHGVRLVVNNPSFDIDFLSRLLRRNGACPSHHYQVMNARDLALGYLLGHNRFDSSDGATRQEIIEAKTDALFETLGVTIDPEKRHTALGDAELIRDVYDKVVGTDA